MSLQHEYSESHCRPPPLTDHVPPSAHRCAPPGHHAGPFHRAPKRHAAQGLGIQCAPRFRVLDDCRPEWSVTTSIISYVPPHIQYNVMTMSCSVANFVEDNKQQTSDLTWRLTLVQHFLHLWWLYCFLPHTDDCGLCSTAVAYCYLYSISLRMTRGYQPTDSGF